MTLETIKNNVDNKIKRMYVEEGKSLEEIRRQLDATSKNFTLLLKADPAETPRNQMLKMYTEFSQKRIKDLDFIEKAFITLNINNNDARHD